MKKYQHRNWFVAITIAAIPCNGFSTTQYGEEEIDRIYYFVTSTQIIDYASKKFNLNVKIKETAEMQSQLLEYQGKLLRECGEKCQIEINDIQVEINKGTQRLVKITDSFKNIYSEIVVQDSKLLGVFSAIENYCGRTYRELMFRDVLNKLSNQHSNKTGGNSNGFANLFEETYRKTINNINSKNITIDCEWGKLHEFYKSISEAHESDKT